MYQGDIVWEFVRAMKEFQHARSVSIYTSTTSEVITDPIIRYIIGTFIVSKIKLHESIWQGLLHSLVVYQEFRDGDGQTSIHQSIREFGV